MNRSPDARVASAWAALTAAFALHVVDEAAHDFLASYNPIARSIQLRLGGIPFPPVFTFRVWLLGLCLGVAIMAALTPAVRAGRRWVAPAAYAYGGIHLLNGLGHILGSLAVGRLAPGVLSAPVLLCAAAWLIREAARSGRGGAVGAPTTKEMFAAGGR